MAVLFQKLSVENRSTNSSIFTSLQIIFSKCVVFCLTSPFLMVINPLFLHEKVCSTLDFCLNIKFWGNRCNCYLYLILVLVKIYLLNTDPSSISSKEERHLEEPGPSLISLSFFWFHLFLLVFFLVLQNFDCFEVWWSSF